jgi:hypothetical protein
MLLRQEGLPGLSLSGNPSFEAVHTEAAALAKFLKGLDPVDWAQDSACPEWQVAM